jgi:uncharacterized protein YbjT (DUF2867 family)
LNVLLFGATGMVGSGVLIECLEDERVRGVTAPVRRPTGITDDKLNEFRHEDFFHYEGIESALTGFDACFFCLGVSAAGMDEARYSRLTYDLTLAAARTLVDLNPQMVFCYVSGAGTDSTEAGRFMWARVKGRTENALLGLPFRAAYMFRPAFIQPLRGVRSRVALYRAVYAVTGPLFPILRRVSPRFVTTTEIVGRAMIRVALDGYRKPILENDDINRVGRQP